MAITALLQGGERSQEEMPRKSAAVVLDSLSFFVLELTVKYQNQLNWFERE